MTSITIVLSEDRLRQLQQIATRFHVTPEELVRISVEELLSRPEEEFRRALEYVLRKNTELYQRLA
jgi:predicted transcriptional regulator